MYYLGTSKLNNAATKCTAIYHRQLLISSSQSNDIGLTARKPGNARITFYVHKSFMSHLVYTICFALTAGRIPCITAMHIALSAFPFKLQKTQPERSVSRQLAQKKNKKSPQIVELGPPMCSHIFGRSTLMRIN